MYTRRKFLRNISFATTGLLILPSAERIWRPSVYEWFSCTAESFTGEEWNGTSYLTLKGLSLEDTKAKILKQIKEFHDAPIESFKLQFHQPIWGGKDFHYHSKPLSPYLDIKFREISSKCTYLYDRCEVKSSFFK